MSLKISPSCNFNISFPCIYQLAGIEKLYVADTKEVEFIVEDNIIIDMFPVVWYQLDSSNVKLTQTIVNQTEDATLEFSITNLNAENKFQLSRLQKTEYSFLLLTKNQELYFVHDTENLQYIEQYNPNGFAIKQFSTKNKSVYQVDYNYYIFNINVEVEFILYTGLKIYYL